MSTTFLTGRTRTLTYSWTIAAVHSNSWTCSGVSAGDEPVQIMYSRPLGVISALGIELSFYTSEGGALGFCPAVSPANAGTHARARVVGGYTIGGGDVADTGDLSILTNSYSRPGSFTHNVSGTASVSVDVEEVCEIYLLDPGLDAGGSPIARVDSNGFPLRPIPRPSDGRVDDYDTAQADGLPGYGANFYERLKQGSTLTGTITIDGLTATCHVAITPANAFDILKTFGGGIDYGSRITAKAQVLATSDTVTIVPKLGLEVLQAGWTSSSGPFSCSATSLGVKAGATSSYPTPTYAQADVALFPLVRLALDTRLRALDDAAWPLSQSIRWQYKGDGTGYWYSKVVNANPGYTEALNLTRFGCAADLNGSAGTGAHSDQWAPQRVWLDDEGLSSSLDDSRDWRMQWRGKPYDAFTVAHAASLTIEDGSSTTDWAAGSHTTASTSSGAVRLAVSGGTGSATITPPTGKKIWEGYRYLHLKIRSTVGDNKAFTLTTNPAGSDSREKSWTGTTGTAGTYVDVYLDLCAPHNKSDAIDAQDYRWPLHTYGATEGPYWGVNSVATFVLGGLVDGETYEIDQIELVRQGWAKTTWLSEFLGWHTKDLSISGRQLKRYCLGDVDGRVALDVTDMELSPLGAYEYLSLSDLASRIAEIPGWTTAMAGSFPSDGYHDGSKFAQWAGGAGALYLNTAPNTYAWTDRIDVDTTGSVTIKAQPQWDEVDAYPQIEDPWNQSGYSDYTAPLPLASAKFLRGSAWGLVLKADDSPYDGASVVAYRTADSSDVRGSATAGTRGQYYTASPWGRGNVHITTELRVGSPAYLSDHETWQNRRRARTSFRKTHGTVKALSYDVSPAERHAVAYIQPADGTRIWTAVAANGTIDSWRDTDSGLDGVWAQVRWLKSPTEKLLLFWGINDGHAYLSTSADDGLTWGAAVTIATGVDFGDQFTDASGIHCYWVDSGTVKGKDLANDGTTVIRTFTTNVTGVDANTDIAVDSSVSDGGKHRVGLFYTSGGNRLFVTAEDGKTFS